MSNSLKRLLQTRIIEHNIYDELVAAYFFLRNTEHRLQEASDQQTHLLPTTEAAQERL